MQDTFKAMGSEFRIIINSENKSLLDFARKKIERLENLWSRFKENSEISLLNKSNGGTVFVSNETKFLLQQMLQAYRITNKIFDPTVLPKIHEIGYVKSLTDENFSDVSENLKWPIDFNLISIEGNLVRLPKNMGIDPGGIGKGLAADLVINSLMELGAKGALVSAGGDVRVAGNSFNGESWKIAVENPFDTSTDVAFIHLTDGGISTSSKLKRTFNSKSNHIFNTLTSKSSDNNVVSVTVISKNAALAEVLAKLPFALSLEDSFKIIESLNSSAFVITDEKLSYSSKNWQNYTYE